MNVFWTFLATMWVWLSVLIEFVSKWTPPLIWHVTPSLVTVIVGGYFLQRFFVKKNNQSTLVEELIKQMDRIQEDALEYWHLDAGDHQNLARIGVLEQKIKGLLLAFSADVAFFILRHQHGFLLNRLLANLVDSCTGGDFESQKRTIEAARYLLIVNAISNLRSALFRTKL